MSETTAEVQIRSLEEVRSRDRDDQSEVRPLEERDELRGEEDEDHVEPE